MPYDANNHKPRVPVGRSNPLSWTKTKHLGTILRHPIDYAYYKMHKRAFANDAQAAMHPHYNSENAVPPMYPGFDPTHGHTQATHEVRRLTALEQPEAVVQMQAQQFQAGVLNTHQAVPARQNVDPAMGGAANRIIFTLQSGAMDPQLNAIVKHHADVPGGHLRTQHSTMTHGQPVASAGFLNVNPATSSLTGLTMSSGHYGPGQREAAKMAVHGKSSGQFDRRQITTQDQHGANVDVSLKARIHQVNLWGGRR